MTRGALTCRACHAPVATKRDGGLEPRPGATITLVLFGQVKLVCRCGATTWFWVWPGRGMMGKDQR